MGWFELELLPSDTEGSDGVAGLGVDGSLTRKLLEHFGGTGEPVSGLSDTDVEDELLDPELPHGVGGFGFGLSRIPRSAPSPSPVFPP